ncbi:acyl-CoA N-acyltransferase [Mycena metata]|uniref:Acyl-CoA N-acyltransferase n=1 Tax=Mycena metata TaxID=1033252 RepID=A0AAD7KEL5_9AGAR|nr:acyl-CoA N-acyltransferase [Mycena metata]
MIADATIKSKSGRIILVPPPERDDEAVAAMRTHPDTRRHLPFFPEHFSLADAAARRVERDIDPTMVVYNIHTLAATPDTPAGTFVGATALTHIQTDYRSCEAGILIAPAFFRTGMATETLYMLLEHAFEERKFHRVEFQTAVDNLAMRTWLVKAGATLEGTRRGYWCGVGADGYTDVAMYGILEEEWLATVKGRLEAQLNASVSVVQTQTSKSNA